MSRAERWTLVAAILGSGIVFLDSSVVNVALKKIGEQLPSTALGALEGQSYISQGYLVTVSALIILAGALNDYYGRRRMFAVGLGGFLVTSVLCGLAPSLELLVVFRVLQGIAGALLVPGSLALLTVTFRGDAQGRAFGLWAGASAATTILGPLVGGVFVDTLSWRAAFLINAPLLAIALWATLTHVRESRDETASGNLDWLGAAVVAVGVGGLSFGTIYGEQRQWRDPAAFAALAIGGIATVALPFLMLLRPNPLIPPELFRSRNFTVSNISTFLIYGALYASGTFQSLFVQGVVGFTAAAAGLSFIPGALFLVFLSSRFGALAARRGPRLFMTVGPATMALGTLWYARIPSTTAAWVLTPGDPRTWLPPQSYFVDLLPASLVFGLGLAIMVAPLTTAVMTSVPSQRSGIASAINNAISRVGAPLMGAVIFVAVAGTFYGGLRHRVPTLDTNDEQVRLAIAPLNVSPPKIRVAVDEARLLEAEREASTDAFHLAMIVVSLLLASGATVNAIGIRDRPLS